ncbi:transmembrane protein [Heterostelium album PN500]|uniref:Transmembrane protein n=1 Tax=Heterostelium pallidum (strain ATCC 26659 / Pp 5 / PN500) TaxID=670386 RepID=D3BJ88_HETP5|nr:transmembrane protein [Heterostelium album PN500]EFA77968.1 transmembrane protein [Heterostelium album PN500]|eukprot:XP_020430096.1 transmembrane protein [Heterostelium album PN500]
MSVSTTAEGKCNNNNSILNSKSITPINIGEQQILDDWGFYNIANNLNSKWTTSSTLIKLTDSSSSSYNYNNHKYTSYINSYYNQNNNININNLYNKNNNNNNNNNNINNNQTKTNFNELNGGGSLQQLQQESGNGAIIASNYSVVFCTDDECGSSRFDLDGYYYALFPLPANKDNVVVYRLSQQFLLYELQSPDTDTFYLDYFVSTTALFPPDVDASIYVFLDNMQVDLLDSIITFGETHSLDLSDFIDISIIGTVHTIEFQISYHLLQPDQLYNFAFQLSGINIRRGLQTRQPLKSAGNIYVDIVNGSDRNGTGSLTSPFNSLAMALSYLYPGDSIIMNAGVYCGQYMNININKNFNLIAAANNADPILTVISGEGLLSSLHIASSATNMLTVNIAGITVRDTYSSRFASGGGILFIEGSVNVSATNCIFENNLDHYDRGAILLRGNSNLVLQASIIRNCSSSMAANYGPAISIIGFESYQSLVIDSCQFIDNQHALYVDQNNYLVISNTQFNGTGETTNLPCSVRISRSPLSTLLNNTFSNSGNGALCIIQSIVNLNQSTFIGNRLEDRAGANLYISQSSLVNIYNSTIRDSFGSSGTAMFVMEHSTVSLYDTTITNIITKENGAIISSSRSYLSLNRVTIVQSVSDYLFYLFYGSVTLHQSTVSNIIGGVWATQTSLTFTDSTIQSIRSGPNKTDTYLAQQCNLVFSNCNFIDHGDIYLASSNIELTETTLSNSRTFIQLLPSSSAFVTNCTFYDNEDSIFLQQSNSYLIVLNSQFYNNRASQGSVLYQLTQAKATFNNNNFTGNSASKNGGCIYVGQYSTTTLTDTIASNNYATSGGFISSESDALISISGGVYQNNSAIGGGGVVYYQNVPTIDVPPILIGNNAGYGNDYASPPQKLSLTTTFPSYIISNTTTFTGVIQIVDQTGQLVKVSDQFSSLKVYLSIDDNTVDLSQVIGGYANFTNVILTGTIGSRVPVTFLSNDPNLFPFMVEGGAVVAPCNPGSIPSPSKSQCQVCQNGNYGYDGITCIQCPSEAYCQNGQIIETKPGYWYDESEYPRVFYSCPQASYCLGNNTCAPHSYGPLCANCNASESYYQWGGRCVHCPSSSAYVLLAPFAGAFLIFWVQRSDSESGLMTIIIYFVQTLMVLSQSVDFSVFSIFNLQLDSGQNGVLGSFCPGPYDYYEKHYMTLLTTPLLLFMLAISTLCIVIVHRSNCISRESPAPRTDLKSSFASGQLNALIKLILTVYSPITQSVLSIFFCTEIGSRFSILIANNSVLCEGSQYRMATAISYGLLVIIIGLPIIIFILLFKNRKYLENDYVIRVYGVFFLKYKPDYYYWDVLMLLRRLAVVAIALMPQSSNLRMFLLTYTSLLFVILQVRYQPFKVVGDNHLELASLVLLFFCCIYLDNDVWINSEQWIVMCCGILFGIYLVYILYNHYKQDILDLINHGIYLVTFGNHGQKRINKYEYLEDDEKFLLGGKKSLSTSLLFDRPRSTSKSQVVSQYGSIVYNNDSSGDEQDEQEVVDNEDTNSNSSDICFNNEIRLMTAAELAAAEPSDGAILGTTPIPSVYQD